jgi:hypothetical protein
LAPAAFQASMPALNATTGMPASVAAFTAGARVSGRASVTAMPSTLLSTAFCTKFA